MKKPIIYVSALLFIYIVSIAISSLFGSPFELTNHINWPITATYGSVGLLAFLVSLFHKKKDIVICLIASFTVWLGNIVVSISDRGYVEHLPYAFLVLTAFCLYRRQWSLSGIAFLQLVAAFLIRVVFGERIDDGELLAAYPWVVASNLLFLSMFLIAVTIATKTNKDQGPRDEPTKKQLESIRPFAVQRKKAA